MFSGLYKRLKGESTPRDLVEELIEGENYVFGEPWELTSESLSAVVPIIRRAVGEERDYVVLQELTGEKTLLIDSGRIDKIKAVSQGVEKPVFVRAGSIFKGLGTQSRANQYSVFLVPGKENLLDVFCVHASHGISARSGFALSSVVPRKVEDALMSPHKSQARVWRAAAVRGARAPVSRCLSCGSSRLMMTYEAETVCLACGYTVAPIPSRAQVLSNWRARLMGDNTVANVEEMSKFNKRVEDVLSKIPADIDGQVGIVVLDTYGVLGLEMFDHPDSWRAFSESVVRNYADVLTKERAAEGLFELKSERIPFVVRNFLKKAKNLSETMVLRDQIWETKALSGDLIGECTTLHSNVMHLILKRTI